LLSAAALVLLRGKSQIYYWAAIAVVAVALTTGNSTPLAHLFFVLPGYRMFRIPPRHFLEASVAVCVLAGYGAVALRDRSRRASPAILVVAFGSLFAMAGLLILIKNWPFQTAPGMTSGVLWGDGLLRSPSLFVPLGVAVASVVVILWNHWRGSQWAALALLA